MRNPFLALIVSLPLVLPGVAGAQACFGPGGCSDADLNPVSPDLTTGPCFGDFGCSTQEQRFEDRPEGRYATVWITLLTDGYVQAGIAGPCWSGDCPDLANQAQAEAEAKLKNALRARRWTVEHSGYASF